MPGACSYSDNNICQSAESWVTLGVCSIIFGVRHPKSDWSVVCNCGVANPGSVCVSLPLQNQLLPQIWNNIGDYNVPSFPHVDLIVDIDVIGL